MVYAFIIVYTVQRDGFSRISYNENYVKENNVLIKLKIQLAIELLHKLYGLTHRWLRYIQSHDY